MPLRRKTPASQLVHWSKDYVEHLRTVHLTLVAASVAIIIIVTSAKPYNPAIAARELHQIMELRALWSPQWIRDNFDLHLRTIDHEEIPKRYRTIIRTAPGFEPVPEGDGGGLEVYVRKDLNHLFPGIETLCLEYPPNNYIAAAGVRLPPSSVPSSLTNFDKWWKDLSETTEVDFPVSLQGVGDPHDDVGLTLWESRVVKKCGEPTFPLTLVFAYDDYDPQAPDKYVPVPLYVTTSEPNKRRAFEIVVLIRELHRAEVSQSSIARFFGNWKIGGYKDVFPDLHEAAKDFESLDLGDVARILDADALKGADVFEVLGIKIPVERLTTWGSLVLLGVQIYLLLFLRELTGKLQPEDPGWDVPWVGMDQSKFGQIVVFLTVVLLPCAAVAILGGQAISLMIADYRDQTHWWKLTVSLHQLGIGTIGRIAVFVVTFAAACVLAAQSWKYRPQVIVDEPAPSCPSQLFE